MQFGDPLSVTAPSDTQLLIERVFKAPPHLVYACYTQPALIQRWLTGPDGWSMKICTYDARDGGNYRFEWQGPEDAFLAVGGVISRIEAPRLIDAEETFDHGVMGPTYRSDMTFADDSDGTLLKQMLTYASMAQRDMIVAEGMTGGMEMSFKSLDRLLFEQNSS
ncbi:SRPBCC domain-containing protein [Devosia soli]|uniref:SRPBCC domain-containing protein n=1 Tax=Devosia soli TaxID=361041 RepID=UPI00069C934A|nr:SRPBCC domain-containing protein [Devosia soli]